MWQSAARCNYKGSSFLKRILLWHLAVVLLMAVSGVGAYYLGKNDTIDTALWAVLASVVLMGIVGDKGAAGITILYAMPTLVAAVSLALGTVPVLTLVLLGAFSSIYLFYLAPKWWKQEGVAESYWPLVLASIPVLGALAALGFLLFRRKPAVA